jgi:hypothetical protein
VGAVPNSEGRAPIPPEKKAQLQTPSLISNWSPPIKTSLPLITSKGNRFARAKRLKSIRKFLSPLKNWQKWMSRPQIRTKDRPTRQLRNPTATNYQQMSQSSLLIRKPVS